MDDLIALVVAKTGWALEYIRALPVDQFNALVYEFSYQDRVGQYGNAHNAALIICTLANSSRRHYKPRDIIGDPPERREGIMENLGTTPEVKKIKLADGKEYELGVITVNTFCALEKKFGQPFTQIFDGRITPLRYLIFLLLKNKPPEMTEETLGELITPDILGELRNSVGV